MKTASSVSENHPFFPATSHLVIRQSIAAFINSKNYSGFVVFLLLCISNNFTL
jgi:hypothetical protein